MRIPKKLSLFPVSSYFHPSFSFPQFSPLPDFPRPFSLLPEDSRRLFLSKRKDFHSSGVSHLHASYSMEENRTTALTERMMDDSYMGGNDYVPKSNVWSSPDGGQKIEIGRQIFCNRSLNMRNIVAVGFDMDYTLAQYKPETFESLAYEGTIKKLVYDLGYPSELLEWSFDWKYMVRGLVLDKKRGNILKMDRYKYVKIAYHGFKELSTEEKVGTYGYTLLRDSFD